MSAALPSDIRDQIRDKLWAKAEELDWLRMSDSDRTTWYENWTRDKDIGGVLSHFMDVRKVRVYIKDSLLKPYLRTRLKGDWNRVLLSLALQENETVATTVFDKPHGRQLVDGSVICWGNSREWKSIILSVFERAYKIKGGKPFAAVLIETGKTASEETRDLIRDVGAKLGLAKVEWIE